MLQQKNREAILFIIPAALLTLVFIYYPLMLNFYYSFHEFSAMSPMKRFVGLRNFELLASDPAAIQSLFNNIKYAVISVFFQVGISFIIAAILEDRLFRKVAPFLRVLYFIPVLASVTVVAFIFQFFYDPMTGLINEILRSVGLSSWQRAWLGDSSTSIYAVIAISQWQSIGYTALLFIVSIQNIPRDIYEAAELEGASKVQQFFYITVPQSREILLVVMIVTIAGAFTVFGEPYILTGGGPGYSSSVLATYLYESAFNQDRMGYASAIALVMFIITMAVLAVQLKISRTGGRA